MGRPAGRNDADFHEKLSYCVEIGRIMRSCDLFAGKARRTGIKFRGVAVSDVHEDVGADVGAGEEGSIRLVRVEAAHGTRVEAEAPQRQQEVGRLQRAVLVSRIIAKVSLPTNQAFASAWGRDAGDGRRNAGHNPARLSREQTWSFPRCRAPAPPSAWPWPLPSARTRCAAARHSPPVGANFMMSTASFRSASGTGRSSQPLWVRASRNRRSMAEASSPARSVIFWHAVHGRNFPCCGFGWDLAAQSASGGVHEHDFAVFEGLHLEVAQVADGNAVTCIDASASHLDRPGRRHQIALAAVAETVAGAFRRP